jgi:hypothetical protein
MKKYVLFAFNGEPMCFIHVLLHALDMQSKQYDVKIVIEGSATKQVRELQDPQAPFAQLYGQVKEAGLIDCVCRACSAQMGALESAQEQGLPICDDLKGHPSMTRYIEAGYTIVTF